jgi:gamma-glutamyltranspeptidase/glutathione hydrolase
MKSFCLPPSLSQRPPAIGAHGMAATSQPLATLAAVDLLREGGSAVDAAIAANAVLSVTEPHMCGPGGDLFAMVWDPAKREVAGLNASGRAPHALSLAEMRRSVGSSNMVPLTGPLTLTTPGAVAGWAALHARFGYKPWARLFEPAIALATKGFGVGARSNLWWQRAVEQMPRDESGQAAYAAFGRTFGAAGRAGPGYHHVNPGLAALYSRLGADGPEIFRHGPVVEAMLAAARAAGGFLDQADFAAVSADWVSPLTASYRGCTVHALPPNGQGLSLLQILAMLELRAPEAVAGELDADWWHVYLEAKKLAFADRARWFADPAFATIPCEALLSADYLATRAGLIDPAHAATDATPGDVRVPASDTTYLAVADSSGCMVSLIQSLFSPFGSYLVAEPFGFALQSRASGFSLVERHPNVYAPGKRPFHTIMPGFVTRQGEGLLALGAIGADMQPQAQAQILARILAEGRDVQSAGALPRMRHQGGALPTGVSSPLPGEIFHETGFAPELIEELRRRGHLLLPVEDPIGSFTGGYQGIMRDPDRGVWWGGSDHRLDGCALGF